MDNSLLPPNATTFERAIASSVARVSRLPVPIGTLWDPMHCPEPLLPWLAWALSVDEWGKDWTVEQKRAVLSTAYVIHRHKGTAGAVHLALTTLGYDIRVVEWFHRSDMDPYTFAIECLIAERPVSAELYAELERIALSTKNARSHLVSVSMVNRAPGEMYIGGPVRTAVVIRLTRVN